jgi:hypothetical protein
MRQVIFRNPRQLGFKAEEFVCSMMGLELAPPSLDHRGIDLMSKDGRTAYQVKWLGKSNSLRIGTIDSLIKGYRTATSRGQRYVLVIVVGTTPKYFQLAAVKDVTLEMLEEAKLQEV